MTLSATGPFGIAIDCHLNPFELRQSSHTQAVLKTPGTSHQFCENSANNAVLGTWDIVFSPGVEIG